MTQLSQTFFVTLMLGLSPIAAEARSRPAPHPSEPDEAPAAKALATAEAKWQALKDDSKRARLRCNWTKVTGLFDRVAEKYPHSAEAPKALLEAGQAYEDLARASFVADDYALAVTAYNRVTSAYAGTPQSADAHLAVARLYRHKLHDDGKARAELQALTKERRTHRNLAVAEKPKTHSGARTSDAEPEAAAAAETLTAAEKTQKGDRTERVEKVAKESAENQEKAEHEQAAHLVEKVDPSDKPQGIKLAATKEDPDPTPASKHDVASSEAKLELRPALTATGHTEATHLEVAVSPAASPIVGPEATEGLSPNQAASTASAPLAAEGPLFKPSEIIPGRAGREHLDKTRLDALKSAVRTSAELPLSAQMGLKVRRVVIDAGHGGHDTGAVGPSGTKEKDVSLAVAKRLAEKLRLQGLDVMLTRSDDHFISLENRAGFANENRADLFVSVHCNAGSDPAYHGVETYSLNVSSNQYAMRLAARENSSSGRSISDLQYLLADLTTKANTADSRHLAHLVQTSMTAGLREKYAPVRDLGTKEALFYVLMGTRMPSILVEGSFISNPVEEHRLTDAAYQDQLAGSIAAGVARFVDERQSLGGMPVAGLP